ncbi:MAG TPA: RNA polymerase sigma factor [Steroidobacteraceae bacterium]|nr:RNA polymerase sigma factor [Steroidobacteraceae bacterium]
MTRELQRTLDAVWRIESAKIIGAVARITRDVGVAEELAQDALVAALEHWPGEGIPANPAAWLMTTARNKALDRIRQAALHRQRQQELGADADARGEQVTPDFVEHLPEKGDIDDDLLRLMFTACHPVLPREAQVALTLKLLAGLTTAEIARAFLLGEPTIAQRIVRAKRTLSGANVRFEMPRGEELQARLGVVLEVIYLIFNEGYTATAGDDWVRPALCEEAQRLVRMLAQLAPQQREVYGLLALLELQASRLGARTDAQGRPILLLQQDRARWDWLLIGRALASLDRARTLPGNAGPYELQAAIAACHGRARAPEQTDWREIVRAYDALIEALPSPVVALNRAVALSMAEGPEAALPLVEALAGEGALDAYHLLPAVRGDLLVKLGRLAEARAQFEQAAALAQNQRERELLLERARATLS